MEPRSRLPPVILCHVFVADGMSWGQTDSHPASNFFLHLALVLCFQLDAARGSERSGSPKAYLGHLVDVVEAGQLDAQHLGWQPDGAPAPLAHLDKPGPPTLAAHQPHRVVKDGDPGLLTRAVRLPSQAPPPALAPPASHAIAGANPPPHWKHCRHERERNKTLN